MECGSLLPFFFFKAGFSPIASSKQPKTASFKINHLRNAKFVTLLFLYSCKLVGGRGHAAFDSAKVPLDRPPFKRKVLAIRGSERSIVQSVPCSILVCHSKLRTRYLVFRTHPLGLSAANGAAPSRTAKHPPPSPAGSHSVSPRNPPPAPS